MIGPARLPGLARLGRGRARYSALVAASAPTAWWRLNDLAAPPVDNSYDSTVLARADTVAYWELGEPSGTTAANSVAGAAYPGTITNSPTMGAAGPLIGSADTAIDFERGSTQYITAAYNAALNPAAFTVSAWVKLEADGAGTARGIVGNRNGATTGGFLLMANSANQWQASAYDAGGISASVLTTTSYSYGTWHHVAMTYDGAVLKLFVNGANVGESTDTYVQNANGAFYIGATGAAANPFDGVMAKVSLHNAALTASEIGSLFVKGRPVSDTQGSYAGGMIDAPVSATGAIAGDSDACFDFDGSNDAVIVPYNAALNAATFSVAGWIYRDVDSGTTEAVCSTQMGSTGGGTSAGYALRIDASDRLQAIIGCGASNAAVNVATLATGAWNHVAMTYDGTTLRLYRNGALEGSNTGTIVASTSQLVIGAAPGGVFPFNGKIDELTYYGSRVLTDNEIASQARAGRA